MGLGVEICGDSVHYYHEPLSLWLEIFGNNLITSDMFYGIGGEKIRRIRDSGGLR